MVPLCRAGLSNQPSNRSAVISLCTDFLQFPTMGIIVGKAAINQDETPADI